jgi:ubiquinol-cytochrome c reductase cytochrome c subunit
MAMSLRLAFCAALLASLSFADSASPQADTQAVAHGRKLYLLDNCYLCHGTVGQGGAAPTIAPPRLPPQSAFSAYVRHPGGRMPPYTQAVLGDGDLAAIYTYLQSLPAPPAQLPKLLSGASASGQ